MGSSEELITAQELADAIGLSVDTIWRYTREKRIPFVKIGSRQYRYNKEEVLKALAGDAAAIAREEPTSYRPHKKLTHEDYAALPEEPGFRFEILDGMLTRDPSPSLHHQRVSKRMYRLLEDYFKEVDPGGEVFYAPVDLSLSEYYVVQPDLLYWPGSRLAKYTPVDVLPELIVEVVSPSTSRKDRVIKLNHYQAAGVPHYWILDPEGGFIEVYELKDGHYVSVARAAGGDFSHPSFPGLSFNIEKLFAIP